MEFNRRLETGEFLVNPDKRLETIMERLRDTLYARDQPHESDTRWKLHLDNYKDIHAFMKDEVKFFDQYQGFHIKFVDSDERNNPHLVITDGIFLGIYPSLVSSVREHSIVPVIHVQYFETDDKNRRIEEFQFGGDDQIEFNFSRPNVGHPQHLDYFYKLPRDSSPGDEPEFPAN